jgi:hypothetical protein
LAAATDANDPQEREQQTCLTFFGSNWTPQILQ